MRSLIVGAWNCAQKLGLRADSRKFGMSLGVRVHLPGGVGSGLCPGEKAETSLEGGV